MVSRILYASIIGFGSVFFAAIQYVAPQSNASLLLQFDGGCYSGRFSLMEKIGTNGSCGAGGQDFIGFPFVINSHINSTLQNVIITGLDALFAIFFVSAALVFCRFLIMRKSSHS